MGRDAIEASRHAVNQVVSNREIPAHPGPWPPDIVTCHLPARQVPTPGVGRTSDSEEWLSRRLALKPSIRPEYPWL